MEGFAVDLLLGFCLNVWKHQEILADNVNVVVDLMDLPGPQNGYCL